MIAKKANFYGSFAKSVAIVATFYCSIVYADNVCNPAFFSPVVKGLVTNSAIRETSGIAASRRNPNVLYVHNDSGNGPQIFAINEVGRLLSTLTVGGWGARDWEDIAVGPGPVDGVNYIYIAETGDNYARWPKCYILRMPEPMVSATQSETSATVTNYDVLTFVYPDGPRDAETVMLDPLTKDIYVVSKREAQVGLYRMPYPQSVTGTNVLQFIRTLPATWVVSGDISPSGYEILVKEPNRILHWCRQTGQSIGAAMAAAPITLPCASEPQGEAIAWRPDGSGYFTLSEGRNQPLHFFARQNPDAPPPGYTVHDFNGDGRADISVFWGAGDSWYLHQSGSNTFAFQTWGDRGALPVPGDYNGDGFADLATYNPENGVWKLKFDATNVVAAQFGFAGVKPVPADYDGDGVTDLAVFHPASGTWYLMMSTGGFQTRQFGWAETVPVPADYDGDGKSDIAVFHPATGNWYIRLSGANSTTLIQFGWGATVPVPADYDGDGKEDLAVYHPATGNWYIRQSTGGTTVRQFGWSAATPVPADYDGDGAADIAVYHQAAGNWYLMRSADGFYEQTFGWSAAVPVASAAAIRLVQ